MSKGKRHALAYLDAYEPGSGAILYAEHLLKGYRDGEFDLPATQDRPSIVSLALFGLEDDEWADAVRAARLQVKLDQLSPLFPLVSITSDHVETDGGRLQVWSGQTLRPSVLEDWLAVAVSPPDMQVFLDSLGLLPPGWSLVAEVARGTK